MRIIKAHSVNEALYMGVQHLAVFGVEQESRNGPVIVAPSPVITENLNPRNRVLVSAARDANPFFHLFESLWMLAGRNDLALPQTFVSTFNKFSDDGKTLHGAYGYRWRSAFGYDQLEMIITDLSANPQSRRNVLAMWDATDDRHPYQGEQMGMADLHRGMEGGKDVPCNTHAYFDMLDGRLNMTVLCRSNDVVLGAHGANAVHFSILLEWMAARIGVPMGVLRQFSNNYHAYSALYPQMFQNKDQMAGFANRVYSSDVYGRPGSLNTMDYSVPVIKPMPLINGAEDADDFQADCEYFCNAVTTNLPRWMQDNEYETLFFDEVVVPMYNTWRCWKQKAFEAADEECRRIGSEDWRLAAQSWLDIRKERRQEKANG